MRKASCRTARAATARGTRWIANATRDECDTYFKVCLKEYQSRVSAGWGLQFSELDLRPFSVGIHFRPRGTRSEKSRIVYTFSFAWPVSRFLVLSIINVGIACYDDATLVIQRFDQVWGLSLSLYLLGLVVCAWHRKQKTTTPRSSLHYSTICY